MTDLEELRKIENQMIKDLEIHKIGQIIRASNNSKEILQILDIMVEYKISPTELFNQE